MKRQVLSLVRYRADPHETFVFYFQGPYGVGKRSTAEALCQALGIGLLVVDGHSLLHAEGLNFETAVRLVLREAENRTASRRSEGSPDRRAEAAR